MNLLPCVIGVLAILSIYVSSAVAETASPDEVTKTVESVGLTQEDQVTDESLSTIDNIEPDGNSAKSVESQLSSADTIQVAIFPYDYVHSNLKPYYNLKSKIKDSFGLAFSIDYAALAQHASFAESGEDIATSHVFRIFGTWLRFGTPKGNMGRLVWKIETRRALFGNPAPRDMGFDTGSALSTANFKVMDYWGITDLYWKQSFQGDQYRILVGHMDSGDWADQYPLLNAWTSFMNDAFYNNPTEAIPKRGFGLVGQAYLTDNTYIMAGMHDANGKNGRLDFADFWNTREVFSWVEYGYRSSRNISARGNSHIHLWHQDQRLEEGTDESWGVVATHSVVTKKKAVAFVRAGYSKGDAPQMRRFIGIGMTHMVLNRDTLGIATSWGSPPDKSLRDQVVSEVFYRVQVTQYLSFTPSVQVTYQPSYTLEKKWVFIPGLRMRMVL